ncbi:MAG: uncharacterized membrane protein YfbV (UPF0208 family) [Cognaticolwellia sp.]
MLLMKLSVLEIILLGRKYMNLWPSRAELGEYFAEYQTVKFSRLICKVMPGLALFCLIMQLYFGSMAVLPQALLYTLCILSFPLQTLIFMGIKADKFLPPALANWYKESVARVNQSGGDIKLSTLRPRYLDLAQLLNLTFKNRLKTS